MIQGLMRLFRFVAAGLLGSALVIAALGAIPAGASTRTAVPFGRVVLWSDISNVLPTLPAPANGAVNGDDFSVTVTGDKCASSVGVGTSGLYAPAGARICVFSLDLKGGGPNLFTDNGQAVPQLEGTIRIGSQSLPLTSNALLDSNTDDYAVAVPKGDSATLSLSAAGFSQSFSLTGARPVGVRPEILYAPAVEQSDEGLVGDAFSFDERAAGDKGRASMTVRVTSAAFSFFLPGDDLVRPTKPDQAFLALDFGEADHQGPGGTEFGELLPEPGSAVRLRLGGRTDKAIAVYQNPLGVLASTYVFTVPADIKTGRISLDLVPDLGAEYTSSGSPRNGVTVLFSSGSFRSGNGATASPAGISAVSAVWATETLVPIAAGGAGGAIVIVIPVVLFWRRRRRGERLVIVFPPPVPLQPDVPKGSGDQGESGELTQASERTVPVVMASSPTVVVGAERPRLTVRVLGPILVDGLGAVDRRQVLAEICCYLALNAGREVPADELRRILGDADNDIAASSLYTYVSKLRSAVGKELFVASGKAGYRFSGEVACDWVSFENLVGSRRHSEEERIDDLKAALGLVRAVPFADAPSGRYEWVSQPGGRNFAAEMTVAIGRAATELAGLLLDAGRDEEAAAAATAGFRGSPGYYPLFAPRLRAVRRDRTRLEQAWRDTEEAIGHDENLRGLHEELVGQAGW
jgi:hypothetical protein